MDVPLWGWLAVLAAVLTMLAVDLFAHRRAHVIEVREAAAWSAAWLFYIPTTGSLAVVVTILATSVGLSLRVTKGQGRRPVAVAAEPPFRHATQDELDELQPLWTRRRDRHVDDDVPADDTPAGRHPCRTVVVGQPQTTTPQQVVLLQAVRDHPAVSVL